MRLPRAGREYARWQVDTPDNLTGFQVQLTTGGPWVNATYAAGVVSLLVKGPNYPPAGIDSDGSGTLVAADCQPTLRCTDNPELVVRQDGWIYLEGA